MSSSRQNNAKARVKAHQRVAEMRDVLCSPKSLGLFERSRISWAGRNEAKRGLIRLLDPTTLSSPFCDRILREANAAIESEWQEASGKMFELRDILEQARIERDSLFNKCQSLYDEYQEKLRIMLDNPHPSDSLLSDNFFQKRQFNRCAKIQAEYQPQIEELNAKIEEIHIDMAPLLAEYKNYRDIAQIHEQVIRENYLAKLSTYVYAATRYCQLGVGMINDDLITKEPQLRNKQLFDIVAFDPECFGKVPNIQ